ncbi:MAG: WYL domain-containing protein [Cyanobacteria bacterium SIG32]|nr:WYL domain-containing protein [Cyanobacteria bacterium SIG32]
MSQKKFKEKYNDGCVKIFNLLKLLYEDNALYDDVIAIFSKDEPDAEKQHVTLNKFLNTLKVFGMNLQKSNKKFTSNNLPFTETFDLDDLKSINMLMQVAKNLPESATKENIQDVVAFLKTRFSENAHIAFENISNNDNKDYSFYYSDLRAKIEMCEKYCSDNFKIGLTYLENGVEVTTFCNAQQVVFDNKNAYLRIFKITEQEIKDINVNNIVEISYLPSQKNSNEVSMTVVFRLKGRLVHAYSLRPNERIDKFYDDSIVIVNSGEPIDALLKRLIRYDSDCVIERPKELRTRMMAMINDTLKNYE